MDSSFRKFRHVRILELLDFQTMVVQSKGWFKKEVEVEIEKIRKKKKEKKRERDKEKDDKEK